MGVGVGVGRPTFAGMVLDAVAQSWEGSLSTAVSVAVTDD